MFEDHDLEEEEKERKKKNNNILAFWVNYATYGVKILGLLCFFLIGIPSGVTKWDKGDIESDTENVAMVTKEGELW